MRTRMILALACSSANLWLPDGSGLAGAAQLEAAHTIAVRYNSTGQVVGIIHPDPDGAGPRRLPATRYTYNQALLVSIETGELSTWADETVAPANWANHGFHGAAIASIREYGYDDDGRKVSEALRGANGALESLVQYKRDRLGRIECKAVRMNPASFGSVSASTACSLGPEGEYGPDRIARFTYNSYDQVLTEERAVGTGLQQTYVANTYSGRLLMSQTDANGNRTELDYDSFKRLWRRYYPSSTTAGSANTGDYNEYTYEANGNLLTERKRNGTAITYGYDQNNRRIAKQLSDNTHSENVGYDYDLRGLTRATYFESSPSVGQFNTFDGFGRLDTATSTVRIGSQTVSRTLSYDHDANGNRTRITHPDGTFFQYSFDGVDRVDGVLENGADTLLTVAYGPDGLRDGLFRGSGASTEYDFDNAHRLASFMQEFTGTTNDLTNTFLYNAAGQVRELTQSNSLYSYVGNQNLSGNYASNGLSQYTVINGQRLTYDSNGNLTGDGSLGYSYDMENRLVATSGVLSGLKYDPLGRLVEIAIVPGTTTQFLYDGDALIAEYTISGTSSTLARRYVHGDRVDEPWVQYNGSAVGTNYRRYLHSDHQGSIIALSDHSGGVLAKNAFDVYGIPGTGNTGRFGYTGQAWLDGLDLNYYKARMYSPRLGRFLQTDPIGYDDDFNLYAYVGNDPLNATDPSGREIRLQAHPVIARMNHAKVTIIPDNQAKYRNDPRFANRLPDGRVYATLGAGPASVNPAAPGKLVGAPNRERDVIQSHNVSDVALTLPEKVEEDTMIERLFSADAAYQDDLDYDFFPGRLIESEGNNSNSYASGLLHAVGFQGFNTPPRTPGFNLPLEASIFKRATVEVTECSTEPDKCKP